MKKCPKCLELKALEFFYNGKEKRCKQCMAKKYKDWKNSENGKLVRSISSARYTRSQKGKDNANRAGKKYRDSRKIKIDPIKKRAREKFAYHVRVGNIEKKHCVVCGALNAQGHHEDYNKPLDVVWLCPRDHKAVHDGKINLLSLTTLNKEFSHGPHRTISHYVNH